MVDLIINYLADGNARIEMTLLVIFSLFFGFICAWIASGKGRLAAGWFIIGALYSLLAVIVLLCIPDLNEEKAKLDDLDFNFERTNERLVEMEKDMKRALSLLEHTSAPKDAA